MKKTIFAIGVISFVLFSCGKENNSDNGGGEKHAVISSANEDDENSISNLDATMAKEIGGLWKLYKTVYPDGGSYVEKENTFLEIKDGQKYSLDNRSGYWFLSFCKDTSGIVTLFTKVQPYSNTDVKITVSRVSKTVENGTTYLKMTALTDGRQSFYIKQQ